MTNTTAVLNATTLGGSITCKDLDASIRWYRDVIGFAVDQTFEHEGKVVTAIVSAGGKKSLPPPTFCQDRRNSFLLHGPRA